MKRFLILILLCGSAHANFYEQGTAIGYIMGVADTGLGIVHCTPANATAGQLNDMMKNYLTNTPAHRHRSADVLVNHVLKSMWPCADRPSGRSL